MDDDWGYPMAMETPGRFRGMVDYCYTHMILKGLAVSKCPDSSHFHGKRQRKISPRETHCLHKDHTAGCEHDQF